MRDIARMNGKQVLRARVISAVLVGAVLATAAAPTMGQDFPNKPIRIIIGNAPGTAPDLAARIVAPGMGKFLGQPVIVESRPGGSGMVAYDFVVKQSAPDGHTLAVSTPNLITIPIFVKDARIDMIKDLPPVTILVDSHLVLSSPFKAPWNNFAEMVTYAKASPGKLNFGATGLQVTTVLYMELIKQKHGLQLVTIPYKGGASQMRPALITNEIQLAIMSEDSFAYAAAKETKVLAWSGRQRHAAAPDVPTFAELGFPELGGAWYGLNAPGATPKAVMDKLYAAVSSPLQQAEVRESMAKVQLHVVGSNPEDSVRRLAAEANAMREVARKAGIQPQ